MNLRSFIAWLVTLFFVSLLVGVASAAPRDDSEGARPSTNARQAAVRIAETYITILDDKIAEAKRNEDAARADMAKFDRNFFSQDGARGWLRGQRLGYLYAWEQARKAEQTRVKLEQARESWVQEKNAILLEMPEETKQGQDPSCVGSAPFD